MSCQGFVAQVLLMPQASFSTLRGSEVFVHTSQVGADLTVSYLDCWFSSHCFTKGFISRTVIQDCFKIINSMPGWRYEKRPSQKQSCPCRESPRIQNKLPKKNVALSIVRNETNIWSNHLGTKKSVFLLTKLAFSRFKNPSPPLRPKKKQGTNCKNSQTQSLTSLCTMFFNTSQTFHPCFLTERWCVFPTPDWLPPGN